MPKIELVTLGLLRELTSGDAIVALAAEPTLASFGDDEDAILEARMFLAEFLAKAEPEIVARFALPEGAKLHTTDVLVPRDDLPRRRNIETAIQMASLVLPTVPNTKGLRDTWVVVLPLLHTFFVSANENLDEAITSEVKRIVAARELTPLEYLDLLPPRGERVVPLDVAFERGTTAEIAKGADLRKRIAEHEARKHAVSVLESIGDAMHTGLPPGRATPRPFPLRDAEIALLRTMLGGEERASTLLVGEARVGKSGLFRAWLEREHELNRTRVVFATSGARLIAGMSGFGQWQERVRRVMEAAQRIDAILYFDDLADLFTDRPGGHVDIPSVMRPFLDEGRVRVVGEIREEILERVSAQNAGFFACFGRVRLEPFDAARASKVLTELTEDQAKRDPNRPRLTPEANAALVELADRYLPYEAFPGKAVRLASEIQAAQELALGSEGAGAKIAADAVHEAFSIRTGVPTFLLRDDRALHVEDVFAKLRARLVGQDEAVRRVAELVCVVKAGLQPAGKPLATLLFVGPTGVGKTELARALAALLFGGEERLVRFDMSEYASAYATERLFRGVDGGEGLLTRKVREQPFSVVLLDEIEKAHPGAFDLLLQIAGEGRLTDGRGKTAYFHNTILIMTSNLGASHRRAQTGFGGGKRDDEAHYAGVVRETFRPELVNRIDRVVAFRTLDEVDIREVTRITVARAAMRRGIVERGIDLAVSDGALAHLAERGMSDAYGARALRRHVDRELMTPLGRLVSGRGRLEGERLVVATEGEATRTGEEPGTLSGGLRFGLVRTPAKRSSGARYTLDAITTLRRVTHRQLRLERIASLRDRVDYLVAQLGYGNAKKKKKQSTAAAYSGEQLAAMSEEHARISALRERLDDAFSELCAVEELALVGFMSGDSIESLRAEAEAVVKRFRDALVQALVADEPRRNAITIMVKELDDRRAFDHWLVPLLADIERRDWRLQAHFDGDRDPAWPAIRRWGPPRTAEELEDKLRSRERTFRNVLLRVEGNHSGIWLALEGGLHSFAGFRAGDPARLHVSVLAQRVAITDAEWEPPSFDPPTPAVAEALTHGPAVREHTATSDEILLASRLGKIELPFADYWPEFEQVALAHLLLFERDGAPDRDAQLRPLPDESFAEVRALLRGGQKIAAIKLYRDLTGTGLAVAKEAVEAMQ